MSIDRPSESVVGPTPPPRKMDILFRPDLDWQANACLSPFHDSEAFYSNGYRLAARSLAEQVCGTAQDQDILVYPIIYLYRHHCELVLKGITLVASDLLDREMTENEVETLGRHTLITLWTNLRPLLNAVCEQANNAAYPMEDLDGIESYIEQIHKHDPDGQRFRYATVKRHKSRKSAQSLQGREPSLSPDLKLINIRVFAEGMEMLGDYLDSIESWFGYLLQGKREMERDAYDSAY